MSASELTREPSSTASDLVAHEAAVLRDLMWDDSEPGDIGWCEIVDANETTEGSW